MLTSWQVISCAKASLHSLHCSQIPYCACDPQHLVLAFNQHADNRPCTLHYRHFKYQRCRWTRVIVCFTVSKCWNMTRNIYASACSQSDCRMELFQDPGGRGQKRVQVLIRHAMRLRPTETTHQAQYNGEEFIIFIHDISEFLHTVTSFTSLENELKYWDNFSRNSQRCLSFTDCKK